MGTTPLFMASLNANRRLVHAFLDKGADPDAPIGDGSGNTARSACRDGMRNGGGEEAFAPVLQMLEDASRARRARREARQKELRETLHSEARSTFDAICEDAVREGILPEGLAAVARGDAAQRHAARSAMLKQLVDARLHGGSLTNLDPQDQRHQEYLALIEIIERTLRLFPAVRIAGLTGKPELNGQVAHISGERTGDITDGSVRYPVRLVASERVVKVKPQNLRGHGGETASTVCDQD